MLKALWLEHQRFLLGTGGVLVVFLLANRMLSGYSEDAERDYRQCRELQKEIDGLHKQLKRTYWAEAVRVDRLGEQERNLAAQISMPSEPASRRYSTWLILAPASGSSVSRSRKPRMKRAYAYFDWPCTRGRWCTFASVTLNPAPAAITGM